MDQQHDGGMPENPQPPENEQPIRYPDDPEHGLDPEIQRRLPEQFAAMHELLRRNASERAADAAMPWLQAN